MTTPQTNGARAAGRWVLQFAGPAILAAIGGYVGVSVKVARVEERIESIRLELKIRDDYHRRDIEALWQSNRALESRIEALKQ